jgi:peptidoglycan/LPS O-acetylase OafA/YrhL
MFMSGYWASRKPISSLADYKAFLWTRLPRIFAPYLFWSFIVLGYSAVKERGIDGSETIYKLLTGGAVLGYYFIIALSQLYILTPLLQYINRRLSIYGVILALIFHLAGLTALYLARLFNVIWRLPWALPFYSWIIYYEIGLFVGSRGDEASEAPKVRFWILPAILVSLLGTLLETAIIYSRYNNPYFAVSPTKYSTLLYSVCVIFGFIYWRKSFGRLPRLISTIGHYSLGIYLIHVIILSQIVRFFQEMRAISSFQPLYQLILIVLTTSICFVIISVSRKLLPAFFYSKVFGF